MKCGVCRESHEETFEVAICTFVAAVTSAFRAWWIETPGQSESDIADELVEESVATRSGADGAEIEQHAYDIWWQQGKGSNAILWVEQRLDEPEWQWLERFDWDDHFWDGPDLPDWIAHLLVHDLPNRLPFRVGGSANATQLDGLIDAVEEEKADEDERSTARLIYDEIEEDSEDYARSNAEGWFYDDAEPEWVPPPLDIALKGMGLAVEGE